MQISDPAAMRGARIIDLDGNKIGKVDEIYLDRDTDAPEFALVNTGLFGSRASFVPLQGANQAGDDLQVPYAKDQVKDAPNIEPGRELSQSEEAELYRYYGLDYGETRSDSGLPQGGGGETREPSTVGHDTSGPETDQAMTRSEEQLQVGKAEHEAGRARLRKYVVTDQVQQTVPVQREEVRVEREPITDANVDQAMSGPAISEEEHEVTLRAEEPVVEKQAVPKERVRLDKEPVTEERQVSDEVRKEQIEETDERR